MSKIIPTLSKMWLKVLNIESILPQKNQTAI